jgi:hypothetical protein
MRGEPQPVRIVQLGDKAAEGAGGKAASRPADGASGTGAVHPVPAASAARAGERSARTTPRVALNTAP